MQCQSLLHLTLFPNQYKQRPLSARSNGVSIGFGIFLAVHAFLEQIKNGFKTYQWWVNLVWLCIARYLPWPCIRYLRRAHWLAKRSFLGPALEHGPGSQSISFNDMSERDDHRSLLRPSHRLGAFSNAYRYYLGARQPETAVSSTTWTDFELSDREDLSKFKNLMQILTISSKEASWSLLLHDPAFKFSSNLWRHC